MTATKSDRVKRSECNGFPRNKSTELIGTRIDLIRAKLAAGEDVLISGFGKFCVKQSGRGEGESGRR